MTGNWKKIHDSNSGCKRQLLHGELDGSGYCCLQIRNAVLCDSCEVANAKFLGLHVACETSPLIDVSPVAETYQSNSCKALNINFSMDAVNHDNVTIDAPMLTETCKSELPSQSHIQAVHKSATENNIKKGISGVKQKLKNLKDYGCIICNLNGSKIVHNRGLAECPYVRNDNLCFTCLKFREVGKCEMKRAIGACFKCGLPKTINGFLLHTDGDWGNNCSLQFQDLVTPLCWYIWRTPEKKKVILEEFRIPIDQIRPRVLPMSDDRAFNEWMFQRSPTGLPNTLRVLNLALSLQWVSINKI